MGDAYGKPKTQGCSLRPFVMKPTEVIATYTYTEAFTQNRVGYASTLSLVGPSRPPRPLRDGRWWPRGRCERRRSQGRGAQ